MTQHNVLYPIIASSKGLLNDFDCPVFKVVRDVNPLGWCIALADIELHDVIDEAVVLTRAVQANDSDVHQADGLRQRPRDAIGIPRFGGGIHNVKDQYHAGRESQRLCCELTYAPGSTLHPGFDGIPTTGSLPPFEPPELRVLHGSAAGLAYACRRHRTSGRSVCGAKPIKYRG
jgi:hypothetical protein